MRSSIKLCYHTKNSIELVHVDNSSRGKLSRYSELRQDGFWNLDDSAHRVNLVVMAYDEIERINRAYNKILAVMLDPDVQEVFGDCFLLPKKKPLPEIQLGE